MERVVVIGSGVVGASAAYRLACSGVAVTLIDAGAPGQATAAGAGIVAPGTSQMPEGPWYPLAAAAAAFYPELVARLAADGEHDAGCRVTGGLITAPPGTARAELDEIRDHVAGRHERGIGGVGAATMLEPDDAARVFPPLASGVPAVHVDAGAVVDGRALRDAMIRAAGTRGATVLHGDAAFDPGGTNATPVIVVGGQRIPCDAVILAAGAWSAALVEPLGIGLPVGPQRGQIAHLDLPPDEAGREADTGAWPFVIGFDGHYLVPFPGGRVVAGATREDGVGFDRRTTAGGVREVLDQALRLAPGLADASVAEIRVGFRPVTPDGLPLLGPIDGLPGTWIATGMGPTGLTVGPFAGALIADLVAGQTPSAIVDIEPFAPLRRMPSAPTPMD
jgi:D-amino-acid dehydrogenase